MAEQIIEKLCPKCNVVKPIIEFYKHKTAKSGTHSHCKTCHNKALKERHSRTKKTETGRPRREWTSSQINLARSLCESGAAFIDIRKQLSTGHLQTKRLLQQEGLAASSYQAPRQYTVDHEAFDELMPDSLYWIGFFFADGTIRKNGADWCIKLAVKDEAHLYKLRDFLQSDYPIHHEPAHKSRNGGGNCFLLVRSRQMADRIVSLGWAKHLKADPVPELCESRHFWRGVVDGDGYIGTISTKTHREYPRISLCGNKDMIEAFTEYVRGILPQAKTPMYRDGVLHVSQFNSQSALSILSILYSNSNTSLDRKARLATSFLSRKHPRWKYLLKERAQIR